MTENILIIEPFTDPALNNIHFFMTSCLLPLWMKLAIKNNLSENQRELLLLVPETIAQLPFIDSKINLSVEIDYFWEDKNWVGRLTYNNGVLSLWSNICQEEGEPQELCAQWQETALKISATGGVEVHSPGLIWFWIDCFKRFVSSYNLPDEKSHGTLTISAHQKRTQINILNDEDEEFEECD